LIPRNDRDPAPPYRADMDAYAFNLLPMGLGDSAFPGATAFAHENTISGTHAGTFVVQEQAARSS
jgi:hypothetical protein